MVMMMMNEGDDFDDDDQWGVKIEKSVIQPFNIDNGSAMDEDSGEW